MKQASLDELLTRPGRVIGTWTQIANADLIDMLGAAGYDFTIIDCEHGAFGIETAETLIRACGAAGVTPLVRVPRGDTVGAYKALDAGAAGVLAPGVESAEHTRALVDALTFAPNGTRGACPIVRAAAHAGQAWPDFAEQQQRNGLIVMIETAAGAAEAEAICAVAGIKAVLIGPFDLSVSLGLNGHSEHPDVTAAVEHVIGVAQRARLPVLMPVFSADEAAFRAQVDHWSRRGVRHFAIGADKIIVTQAMRQMRSWAVSGRFA